MSFSWVVKYYSSFDFFSQLFKNVRNILSEWAICKQVAGWIWPVGHSSQGMFFLQKSAGQGLSVSSLWVNVTCMRLVQTSLFNPAPPSLVALAFSVSFTLLRSFLFVCACQPLTCYIIYLLCVHCVLMSWPAPGMGGALCFVHWLYCKCRDQCLLPDGPSIHSCRLSFYDKYLFISDFFRLWWFLLLYTSDNEY